MWEDALLQQRKYTEPHGAASLINIGRQSNSNNPRRLILLDLENSQKKQTKTLLLFPYTSVLLEACLNCALKLNFWRNIEAGASCILQSGLGQCVVYVISKDNCMPCLYLVSLCCIWDHSNMNIAFEFYYTGVKPFCLCGLGFIF